jgi:hypothetical protein
MIQPGRRAGFLLEARQPIGIGGKGGRQDLDGDVAVEAGPVHAKCLTSTRTGPSRACIGGRLSVSAGV